jgi:hypothetical protein
LHAAQAALHLIYACGLACSRNAITDAGAMALARTLPSLLSLKGLDLA